MLKFSKLNDFNENELELQQMNIKKDSGKVECEKFIDLEQYINSSSFFNTLVYSKNTDKNSPLVLDNEVNLNDITTSSSSYIYKLKDENDITLLFESRFESGNLLAASRIKENEYQLLSQCDTNTLGYTKWFYFRISNTRKNNRVKFSIINQVSL